MAISPPLGVPFVSEYARGNPDYPVVLVRHDPSAHGYVAPSAAHIYPDTDLYPNHTFTGTQLSNTDNTIYWIYRRLPEPSAAGQDVDRELDVTIGYTERVKALGQDIGTAGVEVRPGDYGERTAVVREFSSIAAALAAFSRSYASLVDVSNDLPDVLQGISVVWDEDSGAGGYNETGSGTSSGDRASLSLSLSGSGQGSASVIPSITPDIKTYFGRKVPSTQYLFFLPFPISHAQILTKLTTLAGTTVSAWPQFAPQSHIITLRGGSASLTAKASAQCSTQLSDDNNSVTVGSGTGYGVAIDRILKQEIIRPTIHGTITITDATKSKSTSATAIAVIAGGTNFPGASASLSFPGTASGSITPTSLSPTSPASVPASGLYLHDVSIGSYREGYAKIFAEVVDFSNVI